MSIFSLSAAWLNRLILAVLVVSGAADKLFAASSPIAHVAAAGQPLAFVELVGIALVKAASVAAVCSILALTGRECGWRRRRIAVLVRRPPH